MKVKSNVLLAMHDPLLLKSFKGFIVTVGNCNVVAVASLKEMIIKVNPDSYQLYIMDMNLGINMKQTKEVYSWLAKTGRFISVTENIDLLNAATIEGIPCVHILNFYKYFLLDFVLM